MLQVQLKDVLFNSHHGIHDEEALTGGAFKINLVVQYHPAQLPVNHLEQTVNYVLLYDLVKARMQQRTDLLETLVTEIALSVLDHFSLVEQVNISIDKLHAPISNFQGVVGVSYEIKRVNK